MSQQEKIEFRRIFDAIFDPNQQTIGLFSSYLSDESRQYLFTLATQKEKLQIMDDLFAGGVSEENLERCLLLAANDNSIKSIEKILPLVQKLSDQPMLCAVVMKNWDCVELLLYPVTDISAVLQELSHPDHEETFSHFKAFSDKRTIQQSLTVSNKSSPSKKM